MNINLKKATNHDLETVVKLGLKLWSHHSEEELAGEFSATLARKDAAVILAVEDGIAVGFAQCQLRRDYVEGTSTSPVGYLEGVFVLEQCRKRGIAGKLLVACQGWAKEQGCSEFASDCELTNTQSLKFHKALGFTEANRIICFTKKL